MRIAARYWPTRIARTTRLSIAVVGLLAWFVAYPLWRQKPAGTPLDAAISLSPPGMVEERVTVVTLKRYGLDLVFGREGPSEDEDDRLFGDVRYAGHLTESVRAKGVPVPVRWSVVHVASGRRIAGGQRPLTETDGRAAVELGDRIRIAKLDLEPGDYLIRLQVLSDAPDFARRPARVQLAVAAASDGPGQLNAAERVTFYLLAPAFVWLFVRLIAATPGLSGRLPER